MGRWLSRISGESAAALPLVGLPPAQTTQRYGSEPVSLLTVRLPGYARDMLVSKRPPHRVLAVLSVPQVTGVDEIEGPRPQGADVPGVPDVPQDDRGDTALPRVDRPYRLPPSQADAAHLDPWTPEEIAQQSVGPLSNERGVGNYLLQQFIKSFYNPDGSWKSPQGKPTGQGGRWKTK